MRCKPGSNIGQAGEPSVTERLRVTSGASGLEVPSSQEVGSELESQTKVAEGEASTPETGRTGDWPDAAEALYTQAVEMGEHPAGQLIGISPCQGTHKL